MEKFLRINKRVYPSIRDLRVTEKREEIFTQLFHAWQNIHPKWKYMYSFLYTQLYYLFFIILGNFMQKSAAREREEEKRRLQAEMRRREQELLSKIKDQQRELESMKQEKGKVIFMILFLSLFFC